ncbi:MAG: hypothetical protein U9P71_03175 [Campylobacterota bacterium]|nr:hypothetical protein [Campylobacterota bacterium]
MKKVILFQFVAIISIFLLSGCCGKWQWPYNCTSCDSKHSSKKVQNIISTDGTPCVAYGADSQCIAW